MTRLLIWFHPVGGAQGLASPNFRSDRRFRRSARMGALTVARSGSSGIPDVASLADHSRACPIDVGGALAAQLRARERTWRGKHATYVMTVQRHAPPCHENVAKHIPLAAYAFRRSLDAMELIRIYECLCDVTRLRLLNLLAQGPLCVCHLQDILGEPQVKISKHLSYLKSRGAVEARWEGNWRVYRLATRPSAELKSNLSCLQDCASEQPAFRRDLERLRRLRLKSDDAGLACCGKVAATKTKAR